jgi:hypothetical protein
LLAENPVPKGRKSLAQHGAAGGVLGKLEYRSESRKDGTGFEAAQLNGFESSQLFTSMFVRAAEKAVQNVNNYGP